MVDEIRGDPIPPAPLNQMATAQELPADYLTNPPPTEAPAPPVVETAPEVPTPPRRVPTIHDDVRVPIFGHSSQEFKLPCGYVDEHGTVHNYVTL
jgi:hypothetical protein